jgi:hypothetical protein
MPQSSYIQQLQDAIRAIHGCESRHVSTSRVISQFEGATAWEGEVETFELIGHPKAQRAYAWGHEEAGQLRTTAVLEIPPVNSPSTAVDVAIAAKGRK